MTDKEFASAIRAIVRHEIEDVLKQRRDEALKRISVKINIDDIKKRVADISGVDVDTIEARTRVPEAIFARHAFVYVINESMGLEHGRIGLLISRDRSSVFSALRSFKDRVFQYEFSRKKDPKIRQILDLVDELTTNEVDAF